jgi:Ca2+-binding EF-hand superfamily protein
MKKVILTTVVLLSSVSLLCAANMHMQFENMDTNKDGMVSNSEFTQAKNKNMQEKLNQGKRLKNAGSSPTFSDMDTNKDGKISKEELLIKQNAQMQQRMQEKKAKKMKKGKGMGNGMGKGNRQ